MAVVGTLVVAAMFALNAGVAAGAHAILIPEIPFTVQNICDYVRRREGYGKRFTILVVAEGIKLPPEMKHMLHGLPVGNMIGDAIALMSRKEVRVSVLGHIQRGGSPSAFDRLGDGLLVDRIHDPHDDLRHALRRRFANSRFRRRPRGRSPRGFLRQGLAMPSGHLQQAAR